MQIILGLHYLLPLLLKSNRDLPVVPPTAKQAHWNSARGHAFCIMDGGGTDGLFDFINEDGTPVDPPMAGGHVGASERAGSSRENVGYLPICPPPKILQCVRVFLQILRVQIEVLRGEIMAEEMLPPYLCCPHPILHPRAGRGCSIRLSCSFGKTRTSRPSSCLCGTTSLDRAVSRYAALGANSDIPSNPPALASSNMLPCRIASRRATGGDFPRQGMLGGDVAMRWQTLPPKPPTPRTISVSFN